MTQAQSAVLSTEITEAAIKAVYRLQYNTQKAARYVCEEVPAASYELALQAINSVVRVSSPVKQCL